MSTPRTFQREKNTVPLNQVRNNNEVTNDKEGRSKEHGNYLGRWTILPPPPYESTITSQTTFIL